MTDHDGAPPLLSVENLKTYYPITEGLRRREVGRVRAVDGVSFEIHRGETLGIVGESGSGKTTTALSVVQIEPPTDGVVRFDGDPVSSLSGDRRRSFQRRVQLVVQDPNDAFNPRMRIGEAVAEPLKLHGMRDEQRRRRLVEDLLDRVGLSAADAERYPHEFSGGEKQRIAIARALIVNPDLLVADEPTSALDSRIQSDILALLDDIRTEYDIGILFISHDTDVVRRFCDRVGVMYMGELVERGDVAEVFSSPAHPYTQLLLDSVPSLDPSDRELPRPLTESIPDPADPPSGCRFHTRCPALIPPEEIDLPEDVWRIVAGFRFAVQAGELPDSLGDDTAVDSATVRETFDLPEQIPDDRVEAGVAAAVAAVASGDLVRASEQLAETIPTVCEHETPTATTVDGRMVQCHRYDGDVDAEPRPE